LAAVATDQLVSDRRDDEGLIAEVNIVFCQRPTADKLRKPARGGTANGRKRMAGRLSCLMHDSS
jgi:hypothetical protein